LNIIFWLGFKKDPEKFILPNGDDPLYMKFHFPLYGKSTKGSYFKIKSDTDLIVGEFSEDSPQFQNLIKASYNFEDTVKEYIKKYETFDFLFGNYEREGILDWDNILIHRHEGLPGFNFLHSTILGDFGYEFYSGGIFRGIERYKAPKYHSALRALESYNRAKEKMELEIKQGELLKDKIFFLGFKGSPSDNIDKETDLIIGYTKINNYELSHPNLIRETILATPSKKNKTLDKTIEKFDNMGVLDWNNILIIDNKRIEGSAAIYFGVRGVPKILNFEPIEHPENEDADTSKIFDGIYRFGDTPYETAKDIMDEINGDKFRKENEEIHRAIFGEDE